MPAVKVERYALVVIGGGPAGLAGAIAAGVVGRKVVLVERARDLGGALINTGTIPSKTLRETALALSGFRSRALYGVDLSLRRTARVADFLHHEREVKDAARADVAQRLEHLGVERVQGSASFVDPHVVEVTAPRKKPRRLRGRFILVATGSHPSRPPEFPFEHPRVWDSDEILELENLPKTMAVVGAGVIGSEYASTFQALGAQVHVIDGRDKLLSFLDRELSQRLQEGMTRLGVRFHWNERVKSCEAPERGPIRLALSSGAKLSVDAVLVAAGRRANVEGLAPEAAGLSLDDRSLLRVTKSFRTKVPHIFAAGDVIGFPSLASVSAEQARVAVCTAFCVPLKSKIDPQFPNGIYTIPEASSVGATEEALREKGVDYVVGRGMYADNARGAIIGDASGFLKLIFRRRDMKLLGVHVMGEHATELVHIGMMTMLCGGGADDLHRACFNVPTLGNLYKDAAYRAQIARDLPRVARRFPKSGRWSRAQDERSGALTAEAAGSSLKQSAHR
jgi:NAD(P) transhydrogenase